MSSTSRIGAAVAAGYFLGRFKKLRLALMVGSALANKNVRSTGFGLLQQGTSSLTSSPEAKKLGQQITSQLVEAGRAAAMTAATSRIDRLSDNLNERGSKLRDVGDTVKGSVDGEPEEEPADEYQDEPEDLEDEDVEEEDVDEEDLADEDEEEPEDEYEEEEEEEEPEEDEQEPLDEEDEEPEPEPRPKRKRAAPRRRRAASPAGRS